MSWTPSPQALSFRKDDGGREAAGFRGHAGDCVCRAIAIASGRPYREVYERIARERGQERQAKRDKRKGKRKVASARNGVYTNRKWFKAFMAELGFEWVPTMQIGSGCKVHLADGELPSGRIIVSLSRHYSAVIDGEIRDTYDPRREVHYVESSNRPLRPGEWRNANGICGISRRCVYGFWKLA